MKRMLTTLAVMILVAGAGAVRADSVPVIAGGVHAIELCTQAICGQAFFAGLFQGRVGNNPNAIGIIAVAVNHDELPAPGHHAAITGGRWQLLTGLRFIAGKATGDLLALDDKRFIVTVHMVIDQGGFGDANFTGLLDHNFFPPHLDGVITQ
jgi:hypothetical protein